MRGSRNSISGGEFDALPPVLRRKYFSSLERLRLVREDEAERERPFSRHNTILRTHSHSGQTSFNRRPSTSSTSHRNRLQRVNPVATHPFPPPCAAAWFLSLPPAIRRKHFSPEEQIVLASRKDSVLLDAADEAFYKQGRKASKQISDVSISTRRDSTREHSHELRRSGDFSSDSAIDMDDRTLDSFRWLDEEEELDLKLDDYHIAIKETVQQDTAHRERPSFRRHLSLSSMPFHRRSISSVRASNPPTPVSSNTPPLSTLLPPRHQRSQKSVSSIDPRASHYQDPEARLKLRVYLASPQKFDEAIEFGFPSAQDRLHYARPKTSPRLTHESGRTFLSDETPSLSTDEDGKEGDQEQEQEDSPDPRTPEEATFQHRPSHKSSLARYRVVRGSLEPYANASASDREMTLHMTLTRTDLRGADELQPVRDINAEPLEQPALSFEDPTQSIWDTLPAEGSKMKKIWKKLINKQP